MVSKEALTFLVSSLLFACSQIDSSSTNSFLIVVDVVDIVADSDRITDLLITGQLKYAESVEASKSFLKDKQIPGEKVLILAKEDMIAYLEVKKSYLLEVTSDGDDTLKLIQNDESILLLPRTNPHTHVHQPKRRQVTQPKEPLCCRMGISSNIVKPSNINQCPRITFPDFLNYAECLEEGKTCCICCAIGYTVRERGYNCDGLVDTIQLGPLCKKQFLTCCRDTEDKSYTIFYKEKPVVTFIIDENPPHTRWFEEEPIIDNVIPYITLLESWEFTNIVPNGSGKIGNDLSGGKFDATITISLPAGDEVVISLTRTTNKSVITSIKGSIPDSVANLPSFLRIYLVAHVNEDNSVIEGAVDPNLLPNGTSIVLHIFYKTVNGCLPFNASVIHVDTPTKDPLITISSSEEVLLLDIPEEVCLLIACVSPTLPLAPTELNAISNGPTNILVNWMPSDDPDDILSGYEIQFWPRDRMDPFIIIIEKNISLVVVDRAIANTNYTVTVRAVTPYGKSKATSVTVQTQPIVISVEYLNSASMEVSWSEVDATRYEIAWRSSGDVVGNMNVTTSPYTITGLEGSTEYNIAVCIFKDGDCLGCSDVSVRTVPVAPSVTEVTPKETSVIVTWIGVPDDNIVNYTVTIVPTDGGSPTTVIVGGDKNSTEIEGLQPNTNYTVTVRAVTPDGEGDPTSIAVTTEPAFISVTVESISSTTITLRWSEVEGTTQYKIVWRFVDDGDENEVVPSSPYTITGLSSSTEYYIKVCAFKDEDRLGCSDVSVRTVPVAPSVTEVTPKETSVIVTWIGVPDDNIVNYTVTIGPTDGGSPTTVIVGGDKNSTEIEGLQPNTNYTLTVRAVTPDGEGDPTSIAVTTEIPIARNVIGVSNGLSEIIVTWTHPDNVKIDGYIITLSAVDGNRNISVKLSFNKIIQVFSGLRPNTEYTISVTVFTGDIESDPVIVTATTEAHACRCDPDGSVSSQCDGSTGRCDCLPNVVGARCDQCLSGYWGPRKVFGCTKCDCCQQGIVESSPCNLKTGTCNCKAKFTGARCCSQISGARFNGSSFSIYEVNSGLKESYTISISFRFYQPNGGLVFIPQNQDGSGNSLFVKLENRSLIAYARIGRETLEVRTTEQYSSSQWYKMTLSYSGATLSLSIDDDPSVRISSKGSESGIQIGNRIYLGSIPTSLKLTNIPEFVSTNGLDGCVNSIKVYSQFLGDDEPSRETTTPDKDNVAQCLIDIGP